MAGKGSTVNTIKSSTYGTPLPVGTNGGRGR